MHGSVRVSVCMAAYNGAQYVEEQIASILTQLTPKDELVIVDDSSTDNTWHVLNSLADPRIRLLRNSTNLGYVATFERAIGLSQGQYIFLADQDDVWRPNRVTNMIQALQNRLFVASNFGYFGGQPRAIEKLRLHQQDSTKSWANILTLWVGIRPYYGCAMAFRAEAKNIILPFPHFLSETHDQWIALCANVAREIEHMEEETLDRRLHENNTTPKKMRKASKIIAARVHLARAFFVARRRVLGKITIS
jgi:glycosyltransferase involved in cell wall biosynthesis